jgi:hypothetical protein
MNTGSKRRYIDIDGDDTESTNKSAQKQQFTVRIMDNNQLKKEDWIEIMKSGNSDNLESNARLDALEEKISTMDQRIGKIDQKWDQNMLETKQLLLQLLQKSGNS